MRRALGASRSRRVPASTSSNARSWPSSAGDHRRGALRPVAARAQRVHARHDQPCRAVFAGRCACCCSRWACPSLAGLISGVYPAWRICRLGRQPPEGLRLAMHLGPLVRAMLRNKVRFGLLALEVALTLAIVANCVSLILDARRELTRPSGFVDEQLMLVTATPSTRPSARSLIATPSPTRISRRCAPIRPSRTRPTVRSCPGRAAAVRRCSSGPAGGSHPDPDLRGRRADARRARRAPGRGPRFHA